MATTYWDFANDKPTGDMALKADYKLQKVTVDICDDSNFLDDKVRAVGTYNSSQGWQFDVKPQTDGHKTLLAYSATQAGVYKNIPTPTSINGTWNESSIMSGAQFNLASDYGMSDKDRIGVVTQSSTGNSYTGQYCESFVTPTRPDGEGVQHTYDPTCMVMFRCSGAVSDNIWTRNDDGGWSGKWVELKNKANWLQNLTWQLFITRAMGGGNQREDDEYRQFFLRVDRRRLFEVDYGTTVGSLMSNTNLPTAWKCGSRLLPAIGNWILSTGNPSYHGQALKNIPTNTPITEYADIRIRY